LPTGLRFDFSWLPIDCRKIAISLIGAQKGEGKAHACDKACFNNHVDRESPWRTLLQLCLPHWLSVLIEEVLEIQSVIDDLQLFVCQCDTAEPTESSPQVLLWRVRIKWQLEKCPVLRLAGNHANGVDFPENRLCFGVQSRQMALTKACDYVL
jgi:hypothetical protein